jgi:hypothetical protein
MADERGEIVIGRRRERSNGLRLAPLEAVNVIGGTEC